MKQIRVYYKNKKTEYGYPLDKYEMYTPDMINK